MENINGQTKIKDWYIREYPSDGYARENFNPGATFQNLFECLQVGYDVYAFLGVGDSLVRERMFDALATLMGCSYDHIYYQWLNHGKTPIGNAIIEDMTGLRFKNKED